MIDRVIGIVGIALALLTIVLQYQVPKAPLWLLASAYTVGILLIGVSIGLISAGGLRSKKRVAPNALLRLHVFGDHRAPQLLLAENIFRWYYFQTAINQVGPQGVVQVGKLITLLVTFEDDVVIHTLRVMSPDMLLPIYEVKEFNQRYALIAFSDNVPAGTLEISVSP